MFQAEGFTISGDHLDFSYRDTKAWRRVGPDIDIPSQWISVGDPVSGPAIQFGLMPATPGGGPDLWLDTHYHGSDQFRALIQGQFLLQGRHMTPGEFVYQDSGVPYREGIVCDEPADTWMFAVHGDRRGARSTLVRNDGTLIMNEAQIGEDQLDRYVSSAEDPYWAAIPGGSRGVKALATTLTDRRGAYVWGSFQDAEKWSTFGTGVWASGAAFGDKKTGPVILSIKADGGGLVAPKLTSGAEVVATVVQGDVRIGDGTYERGTVRIQAAGAQLDRILAGNDGASVILLIADRRCLPTIDVETTQDEVWRSAFAQLMDLLTAK